MSYCGRCHACGTKLKNVLDGEEWCENCKQYRRYHSHGWGRWAGEKNPCPNFQAIVPPVFSISNQTDQRIVQ
jgi:hypothetical protein